MQVAVQALDMPADVETCCSLSRGAGRKWGPDLPGEPLPWGQPPGARGPRRLWRLCVGPQVNASCFSPAVLDGVPSTGPLKQHLIAETAAFSKTVSYTQQMWLAQWCAPELTQALHAGTSTWWPRPWKPLRGASRLPAGWARLGKAWQQAAALGRCTCGACPATQVP